MRAMVLKAAGSPLRPEDRPDPAPGPGEVRVRVEACGVCRTDLHLLDGELPQARLPVVPGHEVVGVVDALGEGVGSPALGERVGIPWLGGACGICDYCRHDRENLCDAPTFTGCTRDGGYATHAIANAAFCLPLPREDYPDAAAAAPLLCAGLIGGRALRLAGEGANVGLYGFGAAAHILAQVALHQGRRVFAFTRAGDRATQEFARSLGAAWAGDADTLPPQPLDAAIIFAPAGELVPLALRAVRKGGSVVCGGIHMSDIPRFPYRLLWEERRLLSVANLTRADGHAFLAAAARARVVTHVRRYPLEAADQALGDLRAGRLQGAAVLVPGA
ncbi:zinc-dependent alcohol dehydrogenase family protein [Fulvimonas soli]|jgi:propanol-preferring alcohol dehydrogenase|uniref:Propanol-preferring alcohol dehydrogenase n=1 Tax=Fulvimonas soli TaxID=155197 RepID=A0A316IRM2_9GAMM|nr:zinc-dependent alcohol dehydrogenase family protein [Fulvimonas soli]PWK89751.1 propanol-preferring alcohol dehydrogenase [Fulvimonas soli]TNY27603.1 alcohol dehydrogenase [Fulvimonas soli]